MKVAVYSGNGKWRQHMESCFRLCKEEIRPLEVDFLDSPNTFWSAIGKKRYDLVLLYEPLETRAGRGLFLTYVKRLWEEMANSGGRHTWHFGNQTVALEESEIYYIRSFRKAVSVHTAKEHYRISTSMKREEERFRGKGFVRIHRSFLVNLRHIKQMKGTCMKLDNGNLLQISTRRKKQVREAVFAYGNRWGGR